MPYTGSHVLLRANGHFGASAVPADHWSSGLRIARIDGGDLTVTDEGLVTLLETVSGAYSTFHQNSATFAGADCYLASLSAANVGVDGKYVNPGSETLFRPFAPILSGMGTTIHPWSTALVCSLRTSAARGYASNGRAYWPCLTIPLSGTTGRAGSSSVGNAVANWKTLLDAINDAAGDLGPGGRVSVMSTVGAGKTLPVTAIRMDTRLDQQERRENSQPSEWATATLA